MSTPGEPKWLLEWVKLHPRKVGFWVFIILVWFVPWLSYTPTCKNTTKWNLESEKHVGAPDWVEWSDSQYGYMIKGTMTEDFIEHFTEQMHRSGMPTIRIGRTVRVPLWDWMFGMYSTLYDANKRAISSYLSSNSETNPIWAEMPEEMKRRAIETTTFDSPYAYKDCVLTRWLIMENHGL